jgi:hypothetical protein
LLAAGGILNVQVLNEFASVARKKLLMPWSDILTFAIRVNCFTLSHDFVTCNRSPEVRSIAFYAQPLDLPPVPLMDVGFAITCPLARHRRPRIQFLSIGSRICSTLLSDLASRLGPCDSLSLHLHHVVNRTCTSKLSNVLGTQIKQGAERQPPARFSGGS